MMSLRVDYDQNWKAVITRLFPEWLAFFLPHIFTLVDWSVAPQFLEQELHEALKSLSLKRVDKLVRVQLKNGQQRLILIHVEVETRPSAATMKRMYRYFHLIETAFPDEKITAMVIYTGNYVPKVSDRYRYEAFGTSLTYIFNTYIVKNQKPADLIANPSPFALITLANLYELQTKHDLAQRLTFKEKVYELATERGYTETQIENLLLFNQEVMSLTPELEQTYKTFIATQNPPLTMSHITFRSRGLADVFAQMAYGTSVPEIKEELKKERDDAKKERAEVKKERADALKKEREILAAKAAEQANTIFRLYTIKQMPVEEIADIMALEPAFVKTTLRKLGALKKG